LEQIGIQKMKCMTKMLKLIAILILALLATLIGWPFSVAGILAYLVSGMKFNRWISSLFALLAVVTSRMVYERWPLWIGSFSDAHWSIEIFFGVLNWALAAIVVSIFAHWSVRFVAIFKLMFSRESE
jgi:hypothetical protein